MADTRISLLSDVVPGEVTLDFHVADPAVADFQINIPLEEARAFAAAFSKAVDAISAESADELLRYQRGINPAGRTAL